MTALPKNEIPKNQQVKIFKRTNSIVKWSQKHCFEIY